MSAHRISVVIPHFNRPKMLEQAVASVLAQTLRPAEIIIVDDGSSPAAVRQIRELGESVKIYENETNLGISATRNRGVELATSEWISFLDDDDVYEPNKLELQSAYLDAHPSCDVVSCPLLRITADGSTSVWQMKKSNPLSLTEALLSSAGSLETMLIRREAFLKLGGLDPSFRFLEDLEFGIRLVAAGYRVESLPEPLVLYRCGGGRPQASLNWAGYVRSHLRIVQKYRRLFHQEFGPAGGIKESARQAKSYGLRRGRIPGRSLWAVGCFAELIFGRIPDTE